MAVTGSILTGLVAARVAGHLFRVIIPPAARLAANTLMQQTPTKNKAGVVVYNSGNTFTHFNSTNKSLGLGTTNAPASTSDALKHVEPLDVPRGTNNKPRQ